MARFTALAALLATSASALPMHKRIAQTTIDAVTPWQQACQTAGGGAQCNNIAVTAAETLLAAPPACAQQNLADDMITLAKSLNNDAEMIRLAQIFRQQPRNSPDSLASLYCQTAPKNDELNGLFQCQFASAKQDTFTGNVKAGAAGTIPLGGTAPNPAGSCPANADGPVEDGQQLNKLVQNPGSGNSGNIGGGNGNGGNTGGNNVDNDGGNDGGNGGGNGGNKTTSAAPEATPARDNETGNGSGTVPVTRAQVRAIAVTVGAASLANAAPINAKADPPFLLQNGKDAQKLNKSFQSLTPNSSCIGGEIACVGGQQAQCAAGKFQVTACSGGLQCFALPLLNTPGTTITCTTQAEAEARIAATGATGGIQG